jgi:three-Cys-motif partner protein
MGDASVKFVPGDANNSVDQILSAMPRYDQNHKVLTFCFVDPFQLSSLRFETIKALSTRFIDFLVHIPAMDPLRNKGRYTSAKNNTVDYFLGTDTWRERWQVQQGYIGFDLFIARMFDDQMKSLSYLFGGVEETVLIRSDEKNLPLYRLGFFSRHKLGEKFWRQARTYSNPQFNLF